MKPVIIIGVEDHAQVVADLCRCLGQEVHGLISLSKNESAKEVAGFPVLGDDRVLREKPPGGFDLACGLASVRVSEKREILFKRYKKAGYTFPPLVHPDSTLAEGVTLGEGAQVMAGVIVQTGVAIGHNTLLNTRCSVDHHCQIGDHVHIAPGAVLSGRVRVGQSSFIGAGATIIQGIEVGKAAQVGAGAVVLGPVFDATQVMGIPAAEH